jgi:GT2 family glycosyltransferase
MESISNPQLSIIIVNYKSVALIENCVHSIIRETQRISYEIIVVDNHSMDGCAQRLSNTFPGIRVIELSENGGFARGNNAGIAAAKGELLLLLNPDTLVEDNAIETCYRQFIASEGYSACGVQLLNEDRSLQISGSYNMKGGINFLLALPYWGSVLRRLGYALKAKVPHVLLEDGHTDVDWINGAFIMTTKIAVAQAGPLDEEFFLYSEEIEWCARLKKVGKLCIFGNCRVVHLQGVTTATAFDSEGKGYYNLADRKGLQLIVSGFLRIRKQFGAFWTIFSWLNFLWAIPFSLLGLASDMLRFRQNVKKKARYLWGFYVNTLLFSSRYLWKILSRKSFFYKVL